MATTTWNPADKSASLTLTGSNLIATAAAAFQGVRAIDRQVTGKYYFENTGTTWISGTASIGFSNSTTSLTVISTANAITLSGGSGQIQTGGVQVATLGARANGDIIGMAIDCDARLVWFRVAPSGNWNGSATASPATGAGGLDCSLAGGIGVPLYPFAYFSTNAHSFTTNFGASAFSGTVPAGFTSGWTSGASVPTNAIATQSAIEHWLTTNPRAQITQVAIEQWATVTAALPSTQGARAMVLA